jgi:hypothetical protein
VLGKRRIPDGLEGVRRLHELVSEHAEEPQQVVVGIETDRGLLVQALLAAGYQVYAVNPLAVSRCRDRHTTSRAKSDAGDAKLLADLVRTDRHNLGRLELPVALAAGLAQCGDDLDLGDGATCEGVGARSRMATESTPARSVPKASRAPGCHSGPGPGAPDAPPGPPSPRQPSRRHPPRLHHPSRALPRGRGLAGPGSRRLTSCDRGMSNGTPLRLAELWEASVGDTV